MSSQELPHDSTPPMTPEQRRQPPSIPDAPRAQRRRLFLDPPGGDLFRPLEFPPAYPFVDAIVDNLNILGSIQVRVRGCGCALSVCEPPALSQSEHLFEEALEDHDHADRIATIAGMLQALRVAVSDVPSDLIEEDSILELQRLHARILQECHEILPDATPHARRYTDFDLDMSVEDGISVASTLLSRHTFDVHITDTEVLEVPHMLRASYVLMTTAQRISRYCESEEVAMALRTAADTLGHMPSLSVIRDQGGLHIVMGEFIARRYEVLATLARLGAELNI